MDLPTAIPVLRKGKQNRRGPASPRAPYGAGQAGFAIRRLRRLWPGTPSSWPPFRRSCRGYGRPEPARDRQRWYTLGPGRRPLPTPRRFKSSRRAAEQSQLPATNPSSPTSFTCRPRAPLRPSDRSTVGGHCPNALPMRNRASTAVTPWKPYQGITLAPKTEDLPRNTSAMMAKIQAAETSQTNPAATHHNISTSRPFCRGGPFAAPNQTLRLPYGISLDWRSPAYISKRAGRGYAKSGGGELRQMTYGTLTTPAAGITIGSNLVYCASSFVCLPGSATRRRLPSQLERAMPCCPSPA